MLSNMTNKITSFYILLKLTDETQYTKTLYRLLLLMKPF